jgi:hypothetical protein
MFVTLMEQDSVARKSKLGNFPAGSGDICGTYMTYLRRKARERNLCFEVTHQELWDLYNKQEGRCALSGVPLLLSTKIDRHNNIDREKHTASLDRIDNNKGYTVDNVQWVHKTVNRMRRQYTIDEYRLWCRRIVEYNCGI